MAVDKLVDSTQLDSDLTSVANAIRTKGGTSASLSFPSGFVTAIGNISTGIDVSDTTAVEGDVISGKYFYKANGSKVQGTLTEWNGGTYGGINMIVFSIDGVSFAAEAGMTWTQWVASAYNTDRFYIYYHSTLNKITKTIWNGLYCVADSSNVFVTNSDTIIDGEAYLKKANS